MGKKKANKVLSSYLEQKEDLERKQALIKQALEQNQKAERRKSAGLRNVNRPDTSDSASHEMITAQSQAVLRTANMRLTAVTPPPENEPKLKAS